MPPLPRILAYAGIGLAAGFLSGLFGVGGGILVVPALVMLLGFPQKLATGTSLLAIAPISVVGMITYLVHGSVDWRIGIPLAIGMVAGGVLGSWLLARLPALVITWIFIVVLLAVAIRMFFEDPARGVELPIGWVEIVLLLGFGVLTGVLAGLVGVGGGIIIVPSLIVFFGVGDLAAKGASLVAMVPNAFTTSIQNLLRKNADLAAGLIIGLAGCVATPFGGTLATVIDPRTGAVLFGVFLLIVAAQLITRTIRKMRAA